MNKYYFFKQAVGILIILIPAIFLARTTIDEVFFRIYSKSTSGKLIGYGTSVEYGGAQLRHINRNTRIVYPWLKFSFPATNEYCMIIGQPSVFGSWYSDSVSEVDNLLNQKFNNKISQSMDIFIVERELFDKKCALKSEIRFDLLAIFLMSILIAVVWFKVAFLGKKFK